MDKHVFVGYIKKNSNAQTQFLLDTLQHPYAQPQFL